MPHLGQVWNLSLLVQRRGSKPVLSVGWRASLRSPILTIGGRRKETKGCRMANARQAPDIPGQVISEQTRLHLPSYPHWIEAAVDFLRQKAILSGACQESRAGKLM